MDVHSLAWRTDLALLELEGSVVEDHGTHLVIRTPDNPSYYWGSFLLLAQPPAADSGKFWLETFQRAFPDARHRAIGVDGTTGSAADLKPLAQAGLEVETSTVMTASAVHPPPHPNQQATVRALTSDDDWAQQVDVAVAAESDYPRDFATALNANNRRLVEAGHARWFGAFLNGRLLSSLGLVRAGADHARFQQVKTHPDARGQGLAGTLVHAAGRWGLVDLGVTSLVMVADPDYLAVRVYRSVGFTDTETQLQAARRPADCQASRPRATG